MYAAPVLLENEEWQVMKAFRWLKPTADAARTG
jgi:hypothetical protein